MNDICVDNTLFYPGEKFSSFEALASKLDVYCKSAFVHYWTRDSRKIEGARIIRQINKQLKYYSLKYTCVLGGQAFHSRGTGQRYSFSIRATNCPAHISVRASKDGMHLEVISVNNDHNHEQTEEFFRALPKERKIPDVIKADILDLIKLQVDKNRVKEYVRLQTQKILTTKDLTNIISGGRLENRPDVTPQRSNELLAKVYSLEVEASEIFPNYKLYCSSEKEKSTTKSKKRRLTHDIPKEAYGITEPDGNVIIDCIVSEPNCLIEEDLYTGTKEASVSTLYNSEEVVESEDQGISILVPVLSPESLVVEDSQYCVTCGQHLPKDHVLLQGQEEQPQQLLRFTNQTGSEVLNDDYKFIVKEEVFESFAVKQMQS